MKYVAISGNLGVCVDSLNYVLKWERNPEPSTKLKLFSEKTVENWTKNHFDKQMNMMVIGLKSNAKFISIDDCDPFIYNLIFKTDNIFRESYGSQPLEFLKSDLIEEIKTLQEINVRQEKEKEKMELTNKLVELNDENEECVVEIIQLKQDCLNYQKEIDILTKKLKRSCGEYDVLIAERNSLLANNSHRNQEKDTIIWNLTAKNTKLNKQNHNLSNDIENMTSDFASLAFDMEELKIWKPTHIHKKGGEYMFLGEVIIESMMTAGIAYEDKVGNVWVRPAGEFYDGRFQKI